MKLTSHSLITLVTLALPGCEKSAEWPITPDHGNSLVVEAILTNELKTQEIFLNTTFDALNNVPPVVDNAIVSITAGGTSYDFTHDPLNPGRYSSSISFAATSQLQYELSIAWNGQFYSAVSSLSEVAPLQTIEFEHIDSTNNFTIPDDVVPVFNEVQQAMYQFDLNWSHLQPEGQSTARAYYYTFNTVHISEFIQPPHEDIIFPSGTVAVITKYGLSDGFAGFLRSKVIETDWNGSWFYGNPENAPTNLSNGAFGYFAACAVVRDTAIVQ